MPEVDNREEFSPTWTNEEFHSWLRTQMNRERKWLLAHADDGVIWGRWDNNEIITSNDLAPEISPELRLITLQQAFIFGEQDEVRLWREEDGEKVHWRARRLSDGKNAQSIEETHVLWGSEVVEWPDDQNRCGFTHVRERVSNYGMDHIVPVEVSNEDLWNRKLKLLVRHFITHDEETGEARIALSRLVGLEPDRRFDQREDKQ